MKEFVFLLVFFSIQIHCLHAQKILAFDKRGKVKRIKYYEGEFIKLKTSNGMELQGRLNRILDSSFVVTLDTVNLNQVLYIQNTQKYYGFDILYRACATAGITYLPLTVVNRTINDDSPIVTESAMFVSGGLLGIAFISKAIVNRKYRISKKRPLKIIDISP